MAFILLFKFLWGYQDIGYILRDFIVNQEITFFLMYFCLKIAD